MLNSLIIDVEELLTEGHTVEEIAKILGISESFVRDIEEQLDFISPV